MYTKEKYQPFVSIALATYNGGLYLREQLDSLLAQTYKHFEIVITDDGSTDTTIEILTEFAQRDPRITYTQNTHGKGVVKNFTGAILRCRGEIIFLCDQDDIWHPSKLAKHIAAYADQSVQWVYNEVQLTDATGIQTGLLTDTLPDYWTRRKLLYYTWGSCVLGCATSYRARLIHPFWPADPLAPGHDSWIQLAIYPAKPYYIPEVLQDYRQHGSNAVGIMTDVADTEAHRQLAIDSNLAYLKSLAANPRLQIWKRCLLTGVFLVKQLRRIVNGTIKI